MTVLAIVVMLVIGFAMLSTKSIASATAQFPSVAAEVIPSIIFLA